MKTLADLLRRAAVMYPHRAAVSDSARCLGYSDLERVAGRVAALLASTGFEPGDPVAVAGVRDARLLAVFLAVMRVGGAACVLGPDWSDTLVRRRLQAIAPRCVLTTEADFAGSDESIPRKVVDVDALLATAESAEPLSSAVDPSRPAYLTFTTGTSGAPKAVVVSHANAVHYALSLSKRLAVTESQRVCFAQVTTLAADLGYTPWLLALPAAGHVFVVGDAASRDPEVFWKCLSDNRVTGLKTTPSHLSALLDSRPADTRPLDRLILGGEPLTRSFAAELLTQGVASCLVNHYGPTETTVGTACFVANGVWDLPSDEVTVPIGTAIGEAVLRLEGAESGVLVVAGPGVARYHGADSGGFVTAGRQRVFRTADICRSRDDGSLVFLGRADRQVKISGYRVDPDEVERVLNGHPAVRQAVVVVGDRGVDRRLLAAMSLRAADRRSSDVVPTIEAYLRDRLPSYAIPSPIVPFAALPVGTSGKLDRHGVRVLLDEAVKCRAEQAKAAFKPGLGGSTQFLAQGIAQLWAEALGLPAVHVDADLAHLGVDSILAMRTLALLRRHGSSLTLDDVYQHATPALLALASQRARPLPDLPAIDHRWAPSLAPAQRWFFGQGLPGEGHWNQAVALRCGARVCPEALVSAMRAVLERHSALRWPVSAAGPAAGPLPVHELEPVSFSRLPLDVAGAQSAVSGIGGAVNRGLNPAAGRIVHAHLFRGSGPIEDRLVVAAHHVAMDTVSWRIVLADLTVAYRAAVLGHRVELPPTADYYRWAALQGAGRLRSNAQPVTVSGKPVALTWSLNHRATARLRHRYPCGQMLEAALLSAFSDAIADARGESSVDIEVESHGRGSGADDAAFVETVGWFTAVKWLTVAAGARAPEVQRMVRDAALLPMDTSGGRPKIGFNFLGTFRLPAEPLLGWTPANEIPGPARCAAGDPIYALRLTARVVDDRLVTDLVYRASEFPDELVDKAYRQFATAIAALTGTPAAPVECSSISTSGMPLLTGAAGADVARVKVGTEPAAVLLTGATGYLGGHILTSLIAAGARVTCLVRTPDPKLPVAVERGSVELVVGDVTKDSLGLGITDIATARRGLTTVIHAAADVRLAAPLKELEATNVEGLRKLLKWIDDGSVVPLHQVSTLAVAGTVDGPRRCFSEADLSIGQRFLSPYERSKFSAELLVRSWSQRGIPSFIYRMGHVAAHSRTGAFQRNAADNRIYQTLSGYIAARCAPHLPSSTIAFSHVDTVAAGLVAVALCRHAAPGVYHLESPYDIHQTEVIGWLRACGYSVELVDEAEFQRAVRRLAIDDPARAHLLTSWEGHADRNIRFDRSRTLAELARRGVRFTRPSAHWGEAAIRWAGEAGALPQPAATHGWHSRAWSHAR
ncbi:AMP-binding protein [Mycobacterium sp. SMC-15]|uniref:AMP-binding protein n=1 Tax=Mycobacterium sp. SMC-15 TaxID=3381627 RepID=UPI003876E5C7